MSLSHSHYFVIRFLSWIVLFWSFMIVLQFYSIVDLFLLPLLQYLLPSLVLGDYCMGWLQAWQVMSEFPLEVSHSGSSHEKSSFFRNQCKTWQDCMLEMSRVSVCRQYFACPKRSITFSPGLLSRMQNITLDIYEQHRAPQLCSAAVGKCQMLKQTHLPDSEAAELESRV